MKESFIFALLLIVLGATKAEPSWLFASDLKSFETDKEADSIKIDESRNETLFNEPEKNNSDDNVAESQTQIESVNGNLEGEVQNRSTATEGRSARFLNIDTPREGRIINSDETGSNLAIKGFIPIVGINNEKHDSIYDKQSPAIKKYEHIPQYHHQHVAGPGDQRFIGAALQGLAATLGGNPIRKQGFGGSNLNSFNANAPDCICVPFYMCRNGYLDQSKQAKNSVASSLDTAQSTIKAVSVPPQLNVNSFNQDQTYLPIDERSNDKSDDQQVT